MVEMTWDLELGSDGRPRLQATWTTQAARVTPQPLQLAS